MNRICMGINMFWKYLMKFLSWGITIILPLELLRHLKPYEFIDIHKYHLWQRRQLKILETGLLIHPAVPLEKSNSFAMRLREIIRASDTRCIDTSKNSDTMRTLCNCVVSLSWRSPSGAPTDVCHWADGFPLNLHIYTCLLQAIFDFRDETLVLDEVDELVELMKKTWSTLGINRSIHNLCFTWVLFQQYVVTSQTEPDLLYAAHAMLSTEVANDAKKLDKEATYFKLLSSMLASMQVWTYKRLLQYNEYFQRGNVFLIEIILPLAVSTSKILALLLFLFGLFLLLKRNIFLFSFLCFTVSISLLYPTTIFFNTTK